ncbi:MAG: response regulator transcription factor [Ekhidna sp.]|nr:response regulator transcription factor [Ekhidna sp.]
MTTILLVDDHEVIRDGIKYYFENLEDRFTVTGEASNGKEALETMKEQSFDIILTDLSMPVMDGLELVKELKEHHPGQKVLVLSMIDEVKYIKHMIAEGVDGYVLKSSGEDEIINAIEKITNGDTYFSKDVTNAVVNDLARKKEIANQLSPKLTYETPLTSREKEVLKLIIDQKTNQEIADLLTISIRTVETHKGNLLLKTGAKNIAGLVLYAIEKNLVN